MHLLRTAAVAVALLALAGCSSLKSVDRAKKTLYQQNAAQYYDQGHYERAYQQWDSVLSIDPEDDKARLGQAMALYQLGRQESPEAVERLAMADERLAKLRRMHLEGLNWQAELGHALVQERWVELYDRKVRQLESERVTSGSTDEQELATARAELSSRLDQAQAGFEQVLGGGEREAQYQLTCILGLSRIAALRGDLEQSLQHAHDYEAKVTSSKKLWKEAIERFPREAPLYELKLQRAEAQEAELRDLMGNVLFKLDRLEEAERELDVVLDLVPTRESAYLNRGIVRQALERWDHARSDLQTFLDITKLPDDDPSVVEAARRLAEVEQRLAEEDEALRRASSRS